MDWNSCVRDGNSVKITADRKRALFLASQAEKTLGIVGKIEINADNAAVFFANYYDALLELMHALMYFEGFKVRNHYCLGYYLRDAMKDDASFRVFDRSRILRNSIIYYGESFDKEILLDAMTQIKETFPRLRKRIK